MITIKTYAGYGLKELLGKGTQGKVYRIDSQRCIKIFKSRRVCRDELITLKLAQCNRHFPRLYEAGKDYIVRECINGIELNKYLLTHPLTPDISHKIINLYEAMLKVGYRRLDAAIFHIFITPSGELKLIDTSKVIKKKAVCPKLILSGLAECGYKEEFLNFVKYKRPDLYMRWEKYSK